MSNALSLRNKLPASAHSSLVQGTASFEPVFGSWNEATVPYAPEPTFQASRVRLVWMFGCLDESSPQVTYNVCWFFSLAKWGKIHQTPRSCTIWTLQRLHAACIVPTERDALDQMHYPAFLMSSRWAGTLNFTWVNQVVGSKKLVAPHCDDLLVCITMFEGPTIDTTMNQWTKHLNFNEILSFVQWNHHVYCAIWGWEGVGQSWSGVSFFWDWLLAILPTVPKGPCFNKGVDCSNM